MVKRSVLEEVLRNYVAPEQDNWEDLLFLAEFAINNSWHSSIQSTPFFLNYGQHPLTPADLVSGVTRPAVTDFVNTIRKAVAQAREMLAAAKLRQKQYADNNRRELEFAVGDKVWLNSKHIRLLIKGTRKLAPRFIGPFEVLERIGPVAYRLALPAVMHRIHPVFHVSLLKPFVGDADAQPVVPPIVLEDGEHFEVEAILDRRTNRRRREYLVKWVGYGEEHNSWEPRSNFDDKTFVDEFDVVYERRLS